MCKCEPPPAGTAAHNLEKVEESKKMVGKGGDVEVEDEQNYGSAF